MARKDRPDGIQGKGLETGARGMGVIPSVGGIGGALLRRRRGRNPAATLGSDPALPCTRDGELLAVEEAGHIPHYERPEQVNPRLVEFFTTRRAQ